MNRQTENGSDPFRHRLRVRYTECDQQNVVFYGYYLFYFAIAVTELWREAFGPYQKTAPKLGVDTVVAEAQIRYLAPLRFDDEFDLVAAITTLEETSTVMAISAEREDTVIAEGELRHIFVKPGTFERIPIPAAVKAGLEPYRRR